MSKIGVISVLYNSDKLLPDFFESVARQTGIDYVLYLVDNTPGDSTRKIIKEETSKYGIDNIKHTELDRNIGAAQGNNIGMNQAQADGCDYFILLNNDLYFDNPQLFSSLLNIAVIKNIDMVAPKIYYANSNILWFAGGGVIKWQAAVAHYGNTQEDKGQYDESKLVDYAPTTFILITADVFKKVGEMDTNYFIYSEDLDFIYRAIQQNFKLWYEATLHVYHKVSSTTGGVFSDTGLYYTTRNRVYFAKKFYSPINMATASLYVFGSLLRHSILQKRASAVKAFFKGFWAGIKMSPIKS